MVVSPFTSQLLLERNLLQASFEPSSFFMTERYHGFTSFLELIFSAIYICFSRISLYISSKKHVFALIFLVLCFFYIQKLGSKIIKKTSHIIIPKTQLCFLSFLLLFPKKEPKIAGKQIEAANHVSPCLKKTKLLSIIFSFIMLLIRGYSNKRLENEQNNVVTCKLFESRISPNIPILTLNPVFILLSDGFGCESESITQGRSYSQMNINVSHCIFSRSSLFSGFGSVINVDGGDYSMNVNYSVFLSCISNGQGGAIYFSSTNIYLRMVCAYGCSASYCHFAYLNAIMLNHVEYLSVSYCSNTTTGYLTFRISSGNQFVHNINSSINKVNQASGISIFSPSSFSSSLCTFSNNQLSSVCIYLHSDSNTISMSYSNIVHNSSPSSGVVYIGGSGIKQMTNCIFQNNQNYLFCVSEGSIEISNSIIDHSISSLSTSGAVSTSTNNSFTHQETFQINYKFSPICILIIDQTNSETQMNTPKETSIINNSSTLTLKLAFVSATIIVIVIGIIYTLFFQHSKQERSNTSSSKSDGQITSKI